MPLTFEDETVPLSCVIETTDQSESHVKYKIKVQRGYTQVEVWTISRRYSDFLSLDSFLRQSSVTLNLPPKKVFGNTSREFIAERQQKLQVYLDTVLANRLIANCIYTKRFLHDDLYQDNVQEFALQHISMFLRSEPDWEVVEPLPYIGWRLKKVYFLAKKKSAPKERYILTWCAIGPYNSIEEKEQLALVKTLPTLQHQNLYPVHLAFSNKNGAIIVRPYTEKGSLRDQICKVKPKVHHLKKYGVHKSPEVLSAAEIRVYGRQLLLFMKYMHDKSYPLGHLHLGNVFINEGCVQVGDIENSVLGVPAAYRALVTQHKKCNTMELMDVYSFGHMIYEMTCGVQLNDCQLDSVPPHCSPAIAMILRRLLDPESIKAGLPSVEDLLHMSPFSDVVLPSAPKPIVKIPSKLKECLRSTKQKYEQEAQEEQRTINQIKRRNKLKAHHMSEDERKKRRQSQKRQASAAEGDSPSPTHEDGQDQSRRSNGTTSAGSRLSDPSANQRASNSSTGPPAAPPAPPPPPPAAPPAPAPPPPPPATVPASVSQPDNSRSALLTSISGFSKGKLKKAVTVDKSGPKI